LALVIRAQPRDQRLRLAGEPRLDLEIGKDCRGRVFNESNLQARRRQNESDFLAWKDQDRSHGTGWVFDIRHGARWQCEARDSARVGVALDRSPMTRRSGVDSGGNERPFWQTGRGTPSDSQRVARTTLERLDQNGRDPR
jgi:hypothetical protein